MSSLKGKEDNMKQFTATQIATALEMDATLLRTWGRKWFAGQIVTADSYNNENIRKQLVKTFGEETVVKTLGCPIEEIEVIRSTKVTGTIKRLDPEEMVEGTTYLLISHVNRHTMKFAGKVIINDNMVYLFEPQKTFKTTQDQYRALTHTELTTGDRWQIREIAE